METTTIGRYHIHLPYLSIVKKNNVDSSGMNKKKTHTLYIGKKYLVEGNLTQCMSLLGIPRENNQTCALQSSHEDVYCNIIYRREKQSTDPQVSD